MGWYSMMLPNSVVFGTVTRLFVLRSYSYAEKGMQTNAVALEIEHQVGYWGWLMDPQIQIARVRSGSLCGCCIHWLLFAIDRCCCSTSANTNVNLVGFVIRAVGSALRVEMVCDGRFVVANQLCSIRYGRPILHIAHRCV